MSNNDKAVENGVNTPAQGGEATFSQDDLNRIVSKRLAEERSKLEAAIVERERVLEQEQFRFKATKRLEEIGLGADFLDALNTTTPEAFEKAMAAVESVIMPKKQEQESQVKMPRFTAPCSSHTAEASPFKNGVKSAFGLNKL